MRVTLTITCLDSEDPGEIIRSIDEVLPETAEIDDWDAH